MHAIYRTAVQQLFHPKNHYQRVALKFFAVFYVAYPYYFPHFLPISRELVKRGHKVHYVLNAEENSTLMERIAQENRLDYTLGEEKLFTLHSNYIFFANPYEKARELQATTIFLEHGIGTKSAGFYHIIEYIDIYLTEGSYKSNRLKKLYPNFSHKLKMVGFSKFDAIANMQDEEKTALYHKYGLDPSRKTILYAPTFFPSSIEKMSDNFPADFKECNILIKAHYLTYERKQYKKQRKKLAHWSNFPNCTVVDVTTYDLVPLFAISDVMISDESSAMFEFAALDKPVISNRYFKLRWSYYLIPSKLRKRIDEGKEKYRQILDNANSYEETLLRTKEALSHPQKLSKLRTAFSKEICGTIDGKVSARIADLLEENHG
jgi:CDP-glycerol glycerophosphotransferase (TagB/SpsB family)